MAHEGGRTTAVRYPGTRHRGEIVITKRNLHQPDTGPQDSDQALSPELADLIRNRPLPHPSDRSTKTLLAAARAKTAARDPNPAVNVVQGRSAGGLRFRLRPALAVAACVALAGLVWLNTTGPRTSPRPDSNQTNPALVSSTDSNAATDVLSQLDGRLDRARESLVRLRRRGAGLGAYTVRTQPISKRLVRLRRSALQLRNDVSPDMPSEPGRT